MANTIQILKDGQPVYPITDVSLVIGLEDAIKLPPVKVTTLPTASAETAGKMYYVGPDANDEYERYITSAVNGSYEWIDLGDTSIPLPSIADNLTTDDSNMALSAKQGVVLDGKISQLGQEVLVLSEDFNGVTRDSAAQIGKFTKMPVNNNPTSIFPACSLKKGLTYHFKVEPNGFVPSSAYTYAITLRAMLTDHITSATDPNIVAVLLALPYTDYTGNVIEFDYAAEADSVYLQIYTATASTIGTGVVVTITRSAKSITTDSTLLLADVPADAKAVGDAIQMLPGIEENFEQFDESFTKTPSTSANTSIFPACSLKKGLTYHFKVAPNGYVPKDGYTSAITLRAMLTDSISGASDPNIVAVLLTVSESQYTGEAIEFDYTAEADSVYLQIYTFEARTAGRGVVVSVIGGVIPITDTTLSRQYIPADAKAVGDALYGSGDFEYFGRKLDVRTRRTSIVNAVELQYSGSQGCDVANGKLFQAFDGGSVRVYDFSSLNKTSIGNFSFECASADNHCNSINFGIETPTGCSFPALYISTGKANSPVDFVCHVEGITLTGSTFTSQLLQTITLDSSDWEENGYVPIWGGPHWMVDKERGFLWVFSAKLRTTQEYTGEFKNNKYIATQFNLPLVSAGNLTLGANDILSQKIFDFDTFFTQGGTMKNGKIYYCYGLGDSTYPANVRVFDTDESAVATRMNALFSYEPEDMFIYDDDLYLIAATGVVYKLT